MPPELTSNFLAIYDKEGNLVWTDSSLFEGLEFTANKELEKEVIEDQKQIKKEKRENLFKRITAYIVLAETVINLWVIGKGIYFGYKELKKRGN